LHVFLTFESFEVPLPYPSASPNSSFSFCLIVESFFFWVILGLCFYQPLSFLSPPIFSCFFAPPNSPQSSPLWRPERIFSLMHVFRSTPPGLSPRSLPDASNCFSFLSLGQFYMPVSSFVTLFPASLTTSPTFLS